MVLQLCLETPIQASSWVCNPDQNVSLVPKLCLGMPVGQAPLDNTVQLSSPHIRNEKL
jgi:hypothetical protein